MVCRSDHCKWLNVVYKLAIGAHCPKTIVGIQLSECFFFEATLLPEKMALW